MKKSLQKQLLLNSNFKMEKEFGGAHLKISHAKRPRPIAIKKAMHLTMRSSQASGEKSLRLNKNRIQKIHRIIRNQAKKFGVEIYRYANVGNHIHLLVKANHRKGFISFLRSITGLIARIALGTERGSAIHKKNVNKRISSDEVGHENKQNKKLSSEKISSNGFWDQRPWTRILLTWTEFRNVKKYVEQNFNEALAFMPYKPRKYISTA